MLRALRARLSRALQLPASMAAAATTTTGAAAAGARQRDADVAALLRAHAIKLEGGDHEFDALLDSIPDSARVVLLGEASHGTHEFYRERAYLTRRLITERGFNLVCWEADLPDCLCVDQYVTGGGGGGGGNGGGGGHVGHGGHGGGHGHGGGRKGGASSSSTASASPPPQPPQTAAEALEGFHARFPVWMWRNDPVLSFVGWLRDHNAQAAQLGGGGGGGSVGGSSGGGGGVGAGGGSSAATQPPSASSAPLVRVHGLDLYSLEASREAVREHLRTADPAAAAAVAERFGPPGSGVGDGSGMTDGHGYSRAAAALAAARGLRGGGGGASWSAYAAGILHKRRMEFQAAAAAASGGGGGAATTVAAASFAAGAGAGGAAQTHARRAVEAAFIAEQQALAVRDAEAYYDAVYNGDRPGRVSGWRGRGARG
jgi:erythromycin esterase-like protein